MRISTLISYSELTGYRMLAIRLLPILPTALPAAKGRAASPATLRREVDGPARLLFYSCRTVAQHTTLPVSVGTW